MTCNCYEEKMNVFKKHIEDQLPEGATEFRAEWDGYSFFPSGDYSPVNPKVKFEYRKVKTNGQPAKSLTKDSISMVGNYCCYCGRELKRSDK